MQMRIILWTTSCMLMLQRGLLKAGFGVSRQTVYPFPASSFFVFLLITQPEDNLSFLHLRV